MKILAGFGFVSPKAFGIAGGILSFLLLALPAYAQSLADRLAGIWQDDQGFQTVELLFRSNGRYQLETRSNDPAFDFQMTEQGRFAVSGQTLTLTPYEYLGEPTGRSYDVELNGATLALTRTDFGFTETYQFKPGSRNEVLAKEQTVASVVGRWQRKIPFSGVSEYMFRPGGYYELKHTPEDGQFPPERIRGRYEIEGNQISIRPYSGVEARYELDFFGETLTLIRAEAFSGDAVQFELQPNSEAEVRAKAAETEAFLSMENWQVGVWEIRDAIHHVDLTLRPDGLYIAREENENLRGIVRGRYDLAARRFHLFPFVGQGIYARSNGDFGKVERTRELDYYDGELLIIDLGALSQSVTVARKREGSGAAVLEKVRQAEIERQRPGWHIGVWEVNDPAGWMEFTFRPDNRYIAKSGTGGAPIEVERGRYVLNDGKVTLAPYTGLGPARGFEWDLFDGDLFLVGDLQRMVIAKKVAGSEAEVIEKTENPAAMRGERGGVLGRWTAEMPGYAAELVFRTDGQFRLKRCAGNTVTRDYGLYEANMASRTLVYDSRFVEAQTLGLDFYGDTLTLFGGVSAPSTYTVNLGTVDAAMAASWAADAAEALIDEQWLARVPLASRNPHAAPMPGGDLPPDANPGRVFPAPTVFEAYRLYRRLIPGFVYFNEQGTIKSVAVVNTREWHFFPNGRVAARFRNYRAGLFYPNTIEDAATSWGAYRIEPKSNQQDIFNLYADNRVFFEMDSGDQVAMTLEDGRRNLFWGKDYQILSEWASEQKPVPCEPPSHGNASLINARVSLMTSIEPDPVGEAAALTLRIGRPLSGAITLSGTAPAAARLIVEQAAALGTAVQWQPVLTNDVPAGAFSLNVPNNGAAAGFFRVRVE